MRQADTQIPSQKVHQLGPDGMVVLENLQRHGLEQSLGDVAVATLDHFQNDLLSIGVFITKSELF